MKQDTKLVEALNDLRDEVRKQGVELRRELLRIHDRQVRWIVHSFIGALVLLGLALGGKDLLEVVLAAMP